MRLFPQEEFEVRLGRVREKMIQEKIDYLVIPSNVENDFLYIAGYQPVYGEAVIVIPLGKEPLLFFNTEWDKERIENSTYVEDIRAVEDPVIGSCSYLKSFDADSIGVVGYWELPYRVFKNVESFLSGKVRDASICLREVRLRCSDWEIECYQKAVAIAEAGMLRAVEILKSLQEDISERELAQEIQIAMDREEFGGFSGVCVGSGQRSAQPVALPTDKVIHPGE
ncbi:aminopeptidase P family N-terminal domain-containing protein, partial [Candidatus Bathyarchaeota archaeon]|nr:aminopeptidase P family N-terminal domain-containing protein [Candidatus Bathyarchaeota archaeon]